MKIRKYPKAQLENKRKLFLEIGFIVTLLLVLAAFEYRSYESNQTFEPPLPFDEETTILPPVTVQKPPAPPPPRIYINIIPTDDASDNTSDDFPDVFIDVDEPVSWEPKVKNEEDEVLPDDTPLTIASEVAEFPGGLGALSEYFKNSIVYPKMAKELDVQGTVYIEFIIEKDGSVSNVQVLRGVGFGLDKEAVRVITAMPKWKPARQNGRRVRLVMTVPVKFTLVSY